MFHSKFQMLSTIESVHLDPTMESTLNINQLDNQFGINSQIHAMKPLEYQQQTTQQVHIVPSKPGEYVTMHSIVINRGDENQLEVKIISNSNLPLLAKSQSSGGVDGFCRPILEHLDGNEWLCRLFVKGQVEGLGKITITLSESLRTVSQIILNFLINRKISESINMPKPVPIPKQEQTSPINKIFSSNSPVVQPEKVEQRQKVNQNVQEQPIPVQTNVEFPRLNQISQTQVLQNNMYQTQQNNRFQASQTPYTYYPNQTQIDPEMIQLTNKYLQSSNILQNSEPQVDIQDYSKIGIPQVIEIPEAYYGRQVKCDAMPQNIPNYNQNIPPNYQNGNEIEQNYGAPTAQQMLETVPPPISTQQAIPQLYQYQPMYENDMVPPPQPPPPPKINYDEINKQHIQNTYDQVALDIIPPQQPSQPPRPKKQQAPPAPKRQDEDDEVQDKKEQNPEKKSSKLIRVLPSDVLFNPASKDQPALRPIRLRSTTNQKLTLKCCIKHRYLQSERSDVDYGDDPETFKIIGPSKFELSPCQDEHTDIQAVDVSVRFTPTNNSKKLFIGKLIVTVFAGKELVKTYQVPLLGTNGVPRIEPELKDIANQKVLRMKNVGSGPAFVKIRSKLSNSSKEINGMETSGGYELSCSSVILMAGQSNEVVLSKKLLKERADDEDDVIELRYGSDHLRLLALGKDGHGEWAQLVQDLQLKDDVLRVMGQCIEVVRVVVV